MGLHGTAFTTLSGIVDPNIHFVFIVQGTTAGSRIDVDSILDGFPSRTFTTPSMPYTFGDTLTINMLPFAAMLQHAAGDGSPLIANVLYHNTASVTGLTVLDEQGAPVTNYTIQSESGAIYPWPCPNPTARTFSLPAVCCCCCCERGGGNPPTIRCWTADTSTGTRPCDDVASKVLEESSSLARPARLAVAGLPVAPSARSRRPTLSL